MRDRSRDANFFGNVLNSWNRGGGQVTERGQGKASCFGGKIGHGRGVVGDALDWASGVRQPQPGAQHLVEHVRLSGASNYHLNEKKNFEV